MPLAIFSITSPGVTVLVWGMKHSTNLMSLRRLGRPTFDASFKSIPIFCVLLFLAAMPCLQLEISELMALSHKPNCHYGGQHPMSPQSGAHQQD